MKRRPGADTSSKDAMKKVKEKLKFFQSDSESKHVGRKVLHSTRAVFLFYMLVLSSSFLIGTGIASQVSNTKAATTYRISPSGNDSNPCTASQPCLTMNRAYQVASPGDTVEMAGGSYAKQTISYLASKSTPGDGLANVLFRPISGAVVTIGGVEIFSSNIEVRDVKSSFNVSTNSLSNKDPATVGEFPRILQHPIPSDIVIKNIDASGTSFDVHTANNVYIQNVEVGGFTGTSDGFRISGVSKPYEPTNVVLDNVRLHDVRRTAGSTNHVDCMQISGAKGLTIKNSKFWHCATQGVFFKEASGQTIDNILIENNWFGPCSIPGADVSCTQNLILDDGISNVTVRFNSFGSTAGFRSAGGVGTSNLFVYGNLGGKPTCVGGATPTYRYNVWQPGGSSCHSTDAVASSSGQLGFSSDPSSGSSFDYHISTDSIARNRIPISFSAPDNRSLPNYDIDGQSRPTETNYDAGADEYGSGGSTPAPPPSTPSAPVVTISASPTSTQTNNSSTLSWSATNSPSSCSASGDWSGSKSASGTQGTGALSTAKTYTYTLSCSNAGGSDSDSATVTVTAAPPPPTAKPVVSISVNPSTVNRGGSSTISWSATNSPSSCSASGDWSGSKSASGNQSTGKLNTVKTYSYTLNCTNAGGSTSATVALVVVPNKPRVKLVLAPDTINEGQSSSLTWTTEEDPNSCKASGDWSGDKSTSGGSESTGNVTDSTSKTYTITCSNTGGSTSASVTLSVSTPEAPIDPSVPKPTVSLSAKPETLESGQQSTLTWKTTNSPTSCTASEGWSGDKNVKGGNENTENLTEGKTYVLTCTNKGGSASDSVSISVVTIDQSSGEVRVNNQVVPDLKVDDPSIVGEAKAGEEKPIAETEQDQQDSSLVASTTGFLDTTSGKLTFAGVFAGLITAATAGAFYLKQHFAIKLLPFSIFRGKGGSGDGPVDMISG